MKIAIDIKAACHEKAGKGTYTAQMVKALLTIDKKNTYFLYSDRPSREFPKTIIVKGRSIFWHLNLLRRLKKDQPDIFFAPASYIIPALAPKWLKVIFTVHDLVAFLFPKTHNKKATIIERLTLAKALRKAKYAICVSRNTALDLQQKFGYAKAKTRLIHCAAGDEFKVLTNQKLLKLKQELKLADQFILAVGTLEPRKNLQAILEAFNKIKSNFPNLSLVIVGAKGWGQIDLNQEKVLLLGYVAAKDLVKIYNLAAIFIFSSLYEGFGIPPLEAMQCGCPVICSNTSSLPEVVGSAAYLIDPKNPRQIAVGITDILKNPDLANSLCEKGFKQAEKFSWEKSARQLLELFESCQK